MRRFAIVIPVIVALVFGALICSQTGCKEKAQQVSTPTPQPAAPENMEAQKPETTASAQEEKKADEKAVSPAEEMKKAATGGDFAQMEKALGTLQGVLAGNDPVAAKEAAAVLKDLLHNASPQARAAAVRGLGAKPDAYTDEIFDGLDDPVEDVRMAAISALAGCSPGSRGEKKLIELSKSKDAAVASAAIGALTTLRAKAGGDRLAALVGQLGIPDGDASAQAAISLKLRGAPALPALERVIRTSKNPRQRHAATMCVALICAGTNETQARFASLAKAERREKVEQYPANLKGLPILIYALNDPDPMTREIAAQGLGYLGDVRAAAPLARALKDPDPHVRRRAAAALITTPAKSVQRQIEDAALHDREAIVRRFAVEALGWIGDLSVVPALARACSDSSADVRRYAALQLGRMGELVKGKEAEAQWAQVRPLAVEALVKLFKDRDEDVRWAAVKAVGDLRDENATQYLVAALDDPVPQVSNAAEAGLQRLGIAKRRLPGAK